MNLLGGHMAAPAAAIDRDLEQVLLGLADGSYVLSTPDGSVAESGVGVVGLLGAPAERLVGQPIADVLIAGADEQARGDFEQLLRAPSVDPSARRTFSARCAEGTTRSLQFVVVSVPLALGWEFTSLLSELRSRDAGTWHPEQLRLRHGRALEAVEGVVRQGTQPDPSARLAGILIVVRDVDAPPLTHEDVDRRMAEQRAAARAAAVEAARRIDEAAGRVAAGPTTRTRPTTPLGWRISSSARASCASASRTPSAMPPRRRSSATRCSPAWPRSRPSATPRTALAAGVEDAEGRVAHLASERDEARARLEAMSRRARCLPPQAETARTAAAAAQAELASARAAADAAQADVASARAEGQAARRASRVRARRGAGRRRRGAGRAGQAQSAQADAQAARAELHALRAQAASVGGSAQSAQAEADVRPRRRRRRPRRGRGRPRGGRRRPHRGAVRACRGAVRPHRGRVGARRRRAPAGRAAGDARGRPPASAPRTARAPTPSWPRCVPRTRPPTPMPRPCARSSAPPAPS